MRSNAILLAVLLCQTAAAGEKASLRPPAVNMMPAQKVTIVIDVTRSTQIDYPSRPCIDDNLVNMIPGERILVEADVRDGNLVNLRRVEKAEHPDQTLEMVFSQIKDRNPPFMMLEIRNPFSKLLTYEAGIQPLGQQSFARTSTVPVLPHLTSFESWPEPLTRIVLRNFRLLDSAPQESPRPGTAGAKQQR